MKRFILLVVTFLMLSVPVMASVSLDGSGLTEKQKAEIAAQIEDTKAKNKSSETAVPTIDKAAQWVEVGKNAGLAMASCAKEIGVAGDTFLNSTTGKIVFGVVMFKMIGGPIIHLTSGINFFVVCTCIWFWAFRRTFKQEDIFNEAGKKIKTEYREPSGEYLWAFAVVGAIILVGSALIILTF